MKTNKKLLAVFLVLNGVGLSVALMLTSGLGTDSIGLLCDGIHSYFKISYSSASFIYNFIVIAIAFVLAREHLAIGSVAYALLSGFFIEFYIWALQYFALGDSTIIIRLIMAIFGVILLAFSLAVLIQLHLGMNALDAVIKWLSAKTKISYRVLRTGADIIYALVGTLLGGVFGIGTVASVLFTGYLIDYFTKRIAKESVKLQKSL